MDNIKKPLTKKYLWVYIIISVLVLAGLAYGGYQVRLLYLNKVALEKTLAETEQKLENAMSTLASTSNALSDEKARNDAFEGQINDIAGTVNVLEKIKNTDPQLLQKYSKVYFLNENYTPSGLVIIPEEYRAEKDKELKFHYRVWPHLEKMLIDAKNNNVPLLIISAYRSFSEQASLKSQYTVTYGSGANKFSADQGYSEHQLGTTVDLTTPDLGTNYSSFDKTKAYAWLTQNAYRYGFILSYPKNNDYYVYEPWHWRYVGLELAQKLHDENLNFYDLDQREINKYQANFFD